MADPIAMRMEGSVVDNLMGEQIIQLQKEKPIHRSFRDTLIGKNTKGIQTEYVEENEFISEDEGYGEEVEEEGCLVINISAEEKIRLRRPWRHTLIVKVMGWQIGYNYLLRRVKAL